MYGLFNTFIVQYKKFIIFLERKSQMSSLPLIVKYLIVAFVSMVPIVELRGAIPIAEGLGLNIFIYYPIAIIFNMLPVPIIYLFARKVLEWGKDKKIIGKFFTWCLEKGEKGGEKLKATAGNKGIFFALLLFVGIPLPGTGAWTGTLAASFLNLDFKTSVSAVALGVILAGSKSITCHFCSYCWRSLFWNIRNVLRCTNCSSNKNSFK